MMHLSLIQKIVVYALPLLFAITVHEVAHGWVASKLGDKTAQILGRLTLNPIKHIDMIGTIIVPLILLALGGFIFGWAKPVPINPQNFKNPRRDLALVSISGPFSNLIMAFIWAAIMKLGIYLYGIGLHAALPVVLMGQAGIFINLILMILNLIPIPPLDGGHFVSCLLPGRIAYYYDRIEPYGFLILLILIATRILSLIFTPLLILFYRLIASLFGLG